MTLFGLRFWFPFIYFFILLLINTFNPTYQFQWPRTHIFTFLFSITECNNCADETQTPNRWTMPTTKLGDKRYYIGSFFKVRVIVSFVNFHLLHFRYNFILLPDEPTPWHQQGEDTAQFYRFSSLWTWNRNYEYFVQKNGIRMINEFHVQCSNYGIS